MAHEQEPRYVARVDDRERIAKELWTYVRALNTQNVRNIPAAARAIDSGADRTMSYAPWQPPVMKRRSMRCSF